MRLEQYISDLLYRYECVIVPEFGAFLTQRKGAQLHETTNAFYPPSKVVSFNAQLTSNDGLLAHYIADILSISYDEATAKVVSATKDWKQQLQQSEAIVLKNIGDLSMNTEGNIQFNPSYHLNYLTTSFGLSSFVSPSISREVVLTTIPEEKETEVLEKETEKAPIALVQDKPKYRFPWRYASAAAVVLFAVSVFGFREYQSQQQLTAQNKAQETVTQKIQQATFFNTNPSELPSITLTVAKEIQHYHVVAGAFRVAENADKKISQLQAKGFENASLLGQNKYGLHQVSYASFSTREEAVVALNNIKRNEAPEAWLLVTE